MKRVDKLQEFYNADLLPELTRIDSLRRGVLTRLALLVVAVGVLFPLMAIYVVRASENAFVLVYFVPLFILMAIGFYMLFESVIKNTSYYRDYKKDVIYKLIRFINPTLRYDKRHYISHKEYDHSGFFAKEDVKLDGDDHVSGSIDDVAIEFSELEVEYRKAADKKKFGKEHQFKGIFFVAECPKPFPADLVIEPRQSHNDSDVVLLDIQDEAFNQVFQVRLPNRDYLFQAQEMLSADFRKKVLAFKEMMHNKIYVSFMYNKMYVAIAHEKDLFEPALFASVMSFESVLHHFNDLYHPISIIEHLAAHREFEALQGNSTASAQA